MTQSENYSSASRGLLAQASEELAKGDLRQASEKGWGAAAQMVKAVAERRSWEHTGHALLYQVVRRLVEETGDNQLGTFFHVAGNLHSNFYEDWLPQEMVQSALDSVMEMVDRLEQLLR